MGATFHLSNGAELFVGPSDSTYRQVRDGFVLKLFKVPTEALIEYLSRPAAPSAGADNEGGTDG